MLRILTIILVILAVIELRGQTDTVIIQFSGLVMTEENGQLIPLPYATISIKNTYRGTYSSNEGFFSFVAEKGDTVVFSYVGYKPIFYIIPETLQGDRYSVYQMMTKDENLLPETVVYPWPSREHFRTEFLAMDVSNKLAEEAKKNLANEVLNKMRHSIKTDGDEHTDLYLRQVANNHVYEGQIKPMPIFDVMSWARFFDDWKKGKFKRKK